MNIFKERGAASGPLAVLSSADRAQGWRRREWLGRTAACWWASGVCSVFSASAPAAERAPVAVGQAVPWPEHLTVLGTPGDTVLSPQAWRGMATVWVFFSTDCGYCRRHNQRLNELVRLSQAQGLPLRVFGVAQDRDPAVVKAYVTQQGYRFPVTQDTGLRELFTTRRVIPMTSVVDRQGVLRELIPGEMSEEDIMGLRQWAPSR